MTETVTVALLHYSERLSVDTGHESVSERQFLGALIERLDDDGLATSITAGQHNHNLSWLNADKQQTNQTTNNGDGDGMIGEEKITVTKKQKRRR